MFKCKSHKMKQSYFWKEMYGIQKNWYIQSDSSISHFFKKIFIF